MVFALGLALLIAGFAIREQSAALRWPSLLLMMGNASYSIYLVHNPLLSVTQRLAVRVGMNWGWGLVFGIACSIVAGYVYYLAVERPALRFFQNYSKAKPSVESLSASNA